MIDQHTLRKWTIAATAINQQRQAEQLKEKQKLTQLVVNKTLKEQASIQRESYIRTEAAKLSRFLQDAGMAAKELFQQSRIHFVFGTQSDGGGIAEVFLMDEKGLQAVVESAGLGAALSKTKREPSFRTITSMEAILAAVTYGGLAPEKVVDTLIDHLNLIADHVLKQLDAVPA